MADTQSTFIKRVVSAVLALILLLTVIAYFGQEGLRMISLVVIVLGIREFSRMAFRNRDMPAALPHVYSLICLGAFIVMNMRTNGAVLWLALAAVTFLSVSIWMTRSQVTNENLLSALSLATFGFVYCVLFPYFGVQLITMEGGINWFMFLLFVVFFGDIFAYFFGRWFGRRKFMPLISPNKTWAGSLGGLLGSAFAGTVYEVSTIHAAPVWQTILFCVICGAAAQSGDLLMSLVKRVAQVKDSGSIMPGHGGVLDRLDGVFIACPLVYAFALYVNLATV